MDNYYLDTTKLLNSLKCGEALYRYCFWDNFVSKKKLTKMCTKIGDEFEDEWNDEAVLRLAERIHRHVSRASIGGINTWTSKHHFYALLKNEGRKKLTKKKQRFIKGMVINHCLNIYDDEKCMKCGNDIIRIEVWKNFMKLMGKKVPKGDMIVKIEKCGCGEKLKLKAPYMNNSYTKTL